MPSATEYIRRFIREIKPGKLFTCRDLLGFGSRGAIDQALYFLMKDHQLVRVARGVYMLPGSPEPTVLALAKIKAESFGKSIFMHGANAAQELGFTTGTKQEFAFVCNGRSSSFQFFGGVIHFVGRSPRKLHLKDSLPGKVIRAMWHVGKAEFTDKLIDRTYPAWSACIKQLHASAGLLSGWMNRKFPWARDLPWATDAQSGPPPLFVDLADVLPEFSELFNELDRKWPNGGESGCNG